jgi:CO/xanthine dehydrogenase FAD-binding subunit
MKRRPADAEDSDLMMRDASAEAELGRQSDHHGDGQMPKSYFGGVCAQSDRRFSVTLTDICEHPIINRDYPVVAKAARTISTPILRNMGTIGGNLLLDTRCNYYDQNYEWRKGINFCLKKDGDVCWVAPGSSKCWAVQSSDLVPVMVAIGAKLRFASTLGERVIDAAGLYNDDGIDYLHKRPDELLVDIQLPPTNGWRASYQKLRRRGALIFRCWAWPRGSRPTATP